MTRPDIPGAESVAAWFGEWPSFHDAEILVLHIARDDPSYIRIRARMTTGEAVEGDVKQRREGIVVFSLTRITRLQLEGEDADRQNVLAGLAINRTAEGYTLEMTPCYGLSGRIVAASVTAAVETPHVRSPLKNC